MQPNRYQLTGRKGQNKSTGSRYKLLLKAEGKSSHLFLCTHACTLDLNLKLYLSGGGTQVTQRGPTETHSESAAWKKANCCFFLAIITKRQHYRVLLNSAARPLSSTQECIYTRELFA